MIQEAPVVLGLKLAFCVAKGSALLGRNPVSGAKEGGASLSSRKRKRFSSCSEANSPGQGLKKLLGTYKAKEVKGEKISNGLNEFKCHKLASRVVESY